MRSLPLPLPRFVVANAERRSFLDTDECGLELQSCNRGEGYAYSGVRVVKPGNYCRDTKISVILTIEPGDARLPPHVFGKCRETAEVGVGESSCWHND